jgi:NAD(P)-dependent dehydrogenase (short-subunit alcohol dehydrogenase family)
MKDRWTLENMPELKGKTIIVTGGNSGIGFEAVKAFSGKGAGVIMACRSLEKGETAKAEITKQHPDSKVFVMQLDLSDLSSVHQFAEAVKSKYKELDVLHNNAGIMMPPYGLTKNGFENQMGTNHLGHFALTGLLLDLILRTPGSRVVSISSSGHKYGKMDFSNLLFDRGNGYSPMKAYARSKLSNLLFTYELQRRFEASGSSSMAVAAHPGVADTNLGRFIETKLLVKIMMPVWNAFTQSAAMGALPGIRASVDPDVKPAEYYGPGGYREMKGYPVVVRSSEASYRADDAKELWTVSEKLTGVTYNFEI